MACKTYAESNAAIDRVSAQLKEMIEAARADAAHARENDARSVGALDEARAQTLREARALVEMCRQPAAPARRSKPKGDADAAAD
jgi:hypothetical protein